MKIYIIFGSAGEYDDFHEWAVIACKSEKKAEQIVNECVEYANKCQKEYKSKAEAEHWGYDKRSKLEDKFRKKSPYDKDIEVRGSLFITEYAKVEVELL